jgi:hypothetical protein
MPDNTTLRATVAQDIRAADEALLAEDVVAFVNLAGLSPVLAVRAALGIRGLIVHATGHVGTV